jgi:hypothetical protein
MKFNEALNGARGQIVWIIALIFSTTAIIQLERLEVGAPKAVSVVRPYDAAIAAAAGRELALAEARETAAPEDPQAAASLLTAICLAVQAGILDVDAGRVRAEALRERTSTAGPAWQSAAVLASMTFPP